MLLISIILQMNNIHHSHHHSMHFSYNYEKLGFNNTNELLFNNFEKYVNRYYNYLPIYVNISYYYNDCIYYNISYSNISIFDYRYMKNIKNISNNKIIDIIFIKYCNHISKENTIYDIMFIIFLCFTLFCIILNQKRKRNFHTLN